MSNDDTALVSVPEHTREEIDALKNTIQASNRDMTDAQFTVFMAAARHLGLDPLARQVVPIFQGGRMTVQTTIDGFRLIAERTRKYRGQIGPFWCGKDGAWHDVWLDDGLPVAAKVGVKRSDFDEPMWGVARYKSYAKGGNWNNMPDVMIAKVAESLALRKAFPAELSGAYIREEMLQAQTDETDDIMPVARPEPRQHAQPAPEAQTVIDASVTEDVSAAPEAVKMATKEQIRYLRAAGEALDRAVPATASLTYDDAKTLCKTWHTDWKAKHDAATPDLSALPMAQEGVRP